MYKNAVIPLLSFRWRRCVLQGSAPAFFFSLFVCSTPVLVCRDHDLSTFNWNEAVTMVPLKCVFIAVPANQRQTQAAPLLWRAHVMAFPSAGNHMCCYVMVHICARDAAQRKSRAERGSRLLAASVCVSVRELHPGRLLGAAAECGKAQIVPCLQLELSFRTTTSSALSHVLFFTILDKSHGAQV